MRLKEEDVDVLLGKRKYKDDEIYLDDYDNEINILDRTDDSEDSLFVSNKLNASNLNDNIDSDFNSGGITLIDSSSMESETEAEEITNR